GANHEHIGLPRLQWRQGDRSLTRIEQTHSLVSLAAVWQRRPHEWLDPVGKRRHSSRRRPTERNSGRTPATGREETRSVDGWSLHGQGKWRNGRRGDG